MILIVDDDPSVTASLALLLKQAGYESHSVGGPDAALAWLGREPCELVIQDMNFSRRTTGEEGLDLVRVGSQEGQVLGERIHALDLHPPREAAQDGGALVAREVLSRLGAQVREDGPQNGLVIEAEDFLVLPHPEVLEYMRRKTGDYNRWVGGMRKLARRYRG